MEFKFDHSKKSFYEACNINQKELDELVLSVNTSTKECKCSSEVVQILGDNFSKYELAFLVENLFIQQKQSSNPFDVLREILGDDVLKE